VTKERGIPADALDEKRGKMAGKKNRSHTQSAKGTFNALPPEKKAKKDKTRGVTSGEIRDFFLRKFGGRKRKQGP